MTRKYIIYYSPNFQVSQKKIPFSYLLLFIIFYFLQIDGFLKSNQYKLNLEI